MYIYSRQKEKRSWWNISVVNVVLKLKTTKILVVEKYIFVLKILIYVMSFSVINEFSFVILYQEAKKQEDQI